MTLPRRISDYAAHWASATPDAVAITCDGEHTSYAALSTEVDRWARALLAAGVGTGDRVALRSRPQLPAFVAYLAAASVGAIFQGLNPTYSPAELEHVLADARPVLLIDTAGSEAAEVAQSLGVPQVLAGDEVERGLLARQVDAEALEAARRGVTGRMPAMLVYTSGSTGRPKGALIPHDALVFAAHVQAGRWMPHGGTTLCPFPINHVASLSDLFGTVLAAGGRLVLVPEFDAAELVRLLDSERITLWGFVPAVAALAMQTEEWTRADLSSLELAVWGGGAAPAPLIAALRARGLRVQGCYGSTETVGNVCFSDDHLDDDTLAATIGRADPRYEVRVARPDGTACDVDEEGELVVRATHAFAGYLGRPQESAQALDAQGWLHTGDVAVQRPDGLLTLVGRLHEMFKSGGYNVYPREVELALEALPGVELAAVVPVPDDVYGSVGRAFVVTAGETPPDLRGALRQRLAPYKVPKRIDVVTELPLLAVGKVDKQALRSLADREGRS